MKINIIGRGNVATHLVKAFQGKVEIFQVNPHSLENLNPEADITLISVSDSAIAEVVAKLPPLSGIVAHTSGSTPISIFEGKVKDRYGVFYPLQTFSKNKKLEYDKIPFYIEGSDKETAQKLFNAASLISSNVRMADSEQRKRLHIASVLSCNFVNHLWALSDTYLAEGGLDFNDLIPLLSETMNKVKTLRPKEGQTGPAVRGDRNIIESHLSQLENKQDLRNIYAILSDSILRMYGK
ncbi:MAG: DUF2520 domain-containing protein [Muribaculaceae bacterium]|nr:DUF2520 domain-containing protein [Muribaculaceae bacterium]